MYFLLLILTQEAKEAERRFKSPNRLPQEADSSKMHTDQSAQNTPEPYVQTYMPHPFRRGNIAFILMSSLFAILIKEAEKRSKAEKRLPQEAEMSEGHTDQFAQNTSNSYVQKYRPNVLEGGISNTAGAKRENDTKCPLYR